MSSTVVEIWNTTPFESKWAKTQIVHVPHNIIGLRHDKIIFAVDDPEYQSPNQTCWWRPQDFITISKHYLYKHKEKRAATNKFISLDNGPYCGGVVSVHVLCRLACQIERIINQSRIRSATARQMKTERTQVPQRRAAIQDCCRTAEINGCLTTIWYVWQNWNFEMD